jgi:hypothetical protein
MPRMSDSDCTELPAGSERSGSPASTDEANTLLTRRARPDPCEPADAAMVCERCGKAEMYRMHAVWRCPECGFKTDCCGW